jgi:hypothetical protein
MALIRRVLDIPTHGFQWSRRDEETIVLRVEVGKVGVQLQHPVRLNENNCPNVYQVTSSLQKRTVLHPGNDIVQRPGRYKRDGSRRQIPAPGRGVEEGEEAVGGD